MALTRFYKTAVFYIYICCFSVSIRSWDTILLPHLENKFPIYLLIFAWAYNSAALTACVIGGEVWERRCVTLSNIESDCSIAHEKF